MPLPLPSDAIPDKRKAEELYKESQAWTVGDIFPANKKIAFEYLKMAAEYGHLDAKYELTNLYLKGTGSAENIESPFFDEVTQDVPKAIELLLELTLLGDARGQHRLAKLLAIGIDIDLDERVAFELFQLAAKGGYVETTTCLATCYKKGVGVSIDLKKAFELYTVAANQGCRDAQFELGLCYEKGFGTPINNKLALKYFQFADYQGNVRAHNHLAQCYADEVFKLIVDPKSQCKTVEESCEKGCSVPEDNKAASDQSVSDPEVVVSIPKINLSDSPVLLFSARSPRQERKLSKENDAQASAFRRGNNYA